jgi:hypothetical protein
VLKFVQQNPRRCVLKELKGKLTLRFNSVENIAQAIIILKGIDEMDV